jgi:hypothetical protein
MVRTELVLVLIVWELCRHIDGRAVAAEANEQSAVVIFLASYDSASRYPMCEPVELQMSFKFRRREKETKSRNSGGWRSFCIAKDISANRGLSGNVVNPVQLTLKYTNVDSVCADYQIRVNYLPVLQGNRSLDRIAFDDL